MHEFCCKFNGIYRVNLWEAQLAPFNFDMPGLFSGLNEVLLAGVNLLAC